MLGSLHIATLFGIPIRLHWTFLFLLPFFIADPILLPILFGSVLLHELGHSLMARHFGIHVVDISFMPLGGMARLSNVPESPKVEGLVAIAGPLVNFAITGITLAMAFALPLVIGGDAPDSVASLAVWILTVAGINLVLGTFNLLPAFPMDGGRILRAILARKMDWVRATEIAVKVGRYVVVAAVLISILAAIRWPELTRMSCLLACIALFLFLGGARELMAVRLRHGQSPFGQGPGGIRFGQSGFPFAQGRSPFGQAGPRPTESWGEPSTPPESSGPSADPGDAQRPATWEGGSSSKGFDDDDVRKLEQFRGRLRPQRDDE